MLLECKNLFKNYSRGKMSVPVLKDINLEVEQGEYIAIMGPSGSGKTTLMNLIGCLDVPTSGSLVLNGEELEKMNSRRMADVRNQVLGFVFQQADLLPGLNARENVALPLLYRGIKKQERNKLAEEALIKVGLQDRIDFKPNQLSGGQCQRVAIARAIVGSPKLLLADEPTGALDSQSGQQVMDLFRQLHNEGITIIMITHSAEVAQEAERIVYIRDGILSEDEHKPVYPTKPVTDSDAEDQVDDQNLVSDEALDDDEAPYPYEDMDSSVSEPLYSYEDMDPSVSEPLYSYEDMDADYVEEEPKPQPITETVEDTVLRFVEIMSDSDAESDGKNDILQDEAVPVDYDLDQASPVFDTVQRFTEIMDPDYTPDSDSSNPEDI